MVKHALSANPDCCPHIDRNDSRCGHRFNLGRIEQAFDVCFGAFHTCPMYKQKNREDAEHAVERTAGPRLRNQRNRRCVPIITVTTNGQPIPSKAPGESAPLPLRATGS